MHVHIGRSSVILVRIVHALHIVYKSKFHKFSPHKRTDVLECCGDLFKTHFGSSDLPSRGRGAAFLRVFGFCGLFKLFPLNELFNRVLKWRRTARA